MGLPLVLDVALGLVFIYLILSLLASELQELLTTLFQWRAKHLKEAIEVFLAGGGGTPDEAQVKELVRKLYDDPLLKNVNQESKSLVAKGARTITRWFIPSNRKGAFGTNQSTGPSYIASETFSTSLLERVGLSTLAKKLVEIRLEKFAVRIVGSFHNTAIAAPANGWEKGRISVIAEKANKDLSSDANFATLVEEYEEILNDFNTGETTLVTCVERMGESLDAYIANYPLSPSQTTTPTDGFAPLQAATLSAEPLQIHQPDADQTQVYQPDTEPLQVYQPDAYQPDVESPQVYQPDVESPQVYQPDAYQPEAPQAGEPLSYQPEIFPSESPSDPSIAPSSADLLYFAKRLRAFKLSLFGEKNERAILSGGLRPSLAEMAQLVDESSTTYQEVFQAYESLLTQAEPLEAQVNPELEQQLLEAYPDAIEKEIVQAYPETVEEQFLLVAPTVFRSVEQQLIDRRRKIYRAKLNSQTNLLKQQKQALHKALGQVGGEQRQQILSGVLNQFGGDQRTLIINQSLEQLSNEQRYAVIAIVFTKLDLTTADRAVYDNYQTYKSIQQVLGKLPNSIKESFAILARRAQTKVQQASHDLSQFREEIATWFDSSMSRASGVYKRNAKGVAILIGLVLAAFTNSDAFFIVNRLSNDENLRKVITDRASGLYVNQSAPIGAVSANPTATPAPVNPTPVNPATTAAPGTKASTTPTPNPLSEVKRQTDEALKDLSLPIGWKTENLARQFECQPDAIDVGNDACKAFSKQPGAINPATLYQVMVEKPIDLLKLLFGWAVSGLAISMGAPFWFDLLGKVMNVRNSGSKPPTAAATKDS